VVWYGPRVTMGSHLHPHTTGTIPTFTVQPQGVTALLDLSRLHWIDFGGWLHTKIDHMHWELNWDTVTHPSTNQAQRRLTSLIETSTISLHQTATIQLCVCPLCPVINGWTPLLRWTTSELWWLSGG